MSLTRVAGVGVLAAVMAGYAPALIARSNAAAQERKTPALSEEGQRIQDSIAVLRDLTESPDNAIPEYLLDRAEAIVVIPSLVKGGFIVGAKHGKGVMSVKDEASGQWSAPGFVAFTGGSVGWQIGAESVDLVLLVMNEDGVTQLLEDRFTLGGSVSLTAGPVGRSADADTNAQLNAGILAYSRAQGLFAGASLEGAALHGDDEANAAFYGEPAGLRAIVMSRGLSTPAMAATWQNVMDRITGADR
jgi:lipid-binding SYLF domain-containing protein